MSRASRLQYGLPLALFAAAVFLGLQPPSAGLRGDEPAKPSAATAKRVEAIKKHVDAEYASLDALYKHLHSHPELSYSEEQSAARVAKELKALGFDVTETFGGHG